MLFFLLSMPMTSLANSHCLSPLSLCGTFYSLYWFCSHRLHLSLNVWWFLQLIFSVGFWGVPLWIPSAQAHHAFWSWVPQGLPRLLWISFVSPFFTLFSMYLELVAIFRSHYKYPPDICRETTYNRGHIPWPGHCLLLMLYSLGIESCPHIHCCLPLSWHCPCDCCVNRTCYDWCLGCLPELISIFWAPFSSVSSFAFPGILPMMQHRVAPVDYPGFTAATYKFLISTKSFSSCCCWSNWFACYTWWYWLFLVTLAGGIVWISNLLCSLIMSFISCISSLCE